LGLSRHDSPRTTRPGAAAAGAAAGKDYHCQADKKL
jgi:hypothetical protein